MTGKKTTRSKGFPDEITKEKIKKRIDLVEFIGRNIKLSKTGKEYTGLCPFHDDKKPSLNVDREKGLWHCFGCGAGGDVFDFLQKTEEIDFAEALRRLAEETGVEINATGRGQAVHPESGSNTRTPPALGLKLSQYAEAKLLPINFLRELGLSDISYMRAPAVRMPYYDASRTLGAVRFRVAIAGGDRFRWRSGDKVMLYGLWRLDRARTAGYVVLVEGESDCHTLWHHEIPALGVPGAGNWREEWTEHLEGIPTVYLVVEPDQGGESVLKWLEHSEIRNRVHLVKLGEVKDPSGLYLSSPDDFLQRWHEALESSKPWREMEQARRDEKATEAYTSASELLQDPQLLEHVGGLIKVQGYAGDPTPALLAYVAMTSRLLDRPLNLAFVAPSAVGKNRAIDGALDLIPPESIHVEKAGSARALIYSDEDFQHRMIVVAEADSIPDEGPAASAIRSIAEDNAMTYDVVEHDPKTGRFQTRHITKPGPTGLITTSTRSISNQLGTRMLEVSLRDDEEQTRAVLRSQAQAVAQCRRASPDCRPFLALQRWLEHGGEWRVVVPFSVVLADLVPVKNVRMRRDFRQLLTCIQTVALLCQCQREKTEDGEVIATIGDYGVARNLVASIFEAIVSEGLTKAVRQTVEAIGPSEEISETALAERLNLSKSSINYRVKRAIRGGWLMNEETHKGYPARLRRAAELPGESSVLPSSERVQEAFERRPKDDVQRLVKSETQNLSVQGSQPFKCSTHVGGDSIPPASVDGPDIEPHEKMKLCVSCGSLVAINTLDRYGRCPECEKQGRAPF